MISVNTMERVVYIAIQHQIACQARAKNQYCVDPCKELGCAEKCHVDANGFRAHG